MKRNLICLALVLVVVSLGVSGVGARSEDMVAGAGADSPVYMMNCDYDGPDAVLTPWGYVPASHVNHVDNGSVVKAAPEGDYVYSSEGKLIDFMPKEAETQSWQHRVEIYTSESAAPEVIIPQAGGWIEWANTNTQGNLAAAAAEWQVPGEPIVAGPQTMFLFNGIEDPAGTWIIQPVLQWGLSAAGGDPDDWTGAAWAVDGSLFWYGSVINCNVGDNIAGYISYEAYGEDEFQNIWFEDETTGQTSLLSFWGAFPTSDCVGVVALEGYNFAGDQHVPFNTLFGNVRFFRTDGSQITWPTMLSDTDDWGVLTNLGVDIFFSGPFYARQMNVRLRTANGETPSVTKIVPNAVGAVTQLEPYPAVANYLDVDDPPGSPDNWATYVAKGGEFGQSWSGYDLYNLQNPTGSGTINYIVVHYRCRKIVLKVAAVYAQSKIKTGGTEYTGTQHGLTTSWSDYTQQYNTNPKTGVAWTWTDLNYLQAGVRMSSSPGYTDFSAGYCTQVYVEVNYTP